VKGQLSAEMLILMVVVLAVVAIAAVQLINSAKETSGNLGEQTGRLNSMVTDEMKLPSGAFCFEDKECQGGSCNSNRCN
jgi:hypothetical protein